MKTNQEKILRCSFCNKAQHDVRKLIAGPSVFICDECVEVCRDIIAEDQATGSSPAAAVPNAGNGVHLPCALCKMPTLSSVAVLVEARGSLCPRCVEEIEEAFARRKLLL